LYQKVLVYLTLFDQLGLPYIRMVTGSTKN